MKKKRLMIGGMALWTLTAWALLLTGCGPLTFVVGIGPGQKDLESTVVDNSGQVLADRVAIVDVSGLIFNGARPGLLSEGENPVSLLTEKLEKARQDARVKAVILRINSPGGTVTASDAMYREVLRFKERSGKPVVALLMDVAASGGYYLACSSDRIVAYPTTVTGSVGVIVQTLSLKPALNRLGVQTDAITSGPNKDAGSPLSVLTPEQREIFQSLVDDFYQRFVAVVRKARPGIPAEQVNTVTDGRVMSGTQALEYGMVDQVGDLHQAFALARQLAKIPQADLVIYHRPLSYVGSPYAISPAAVPAAGTQINLAQINFVQGLADQSAGFYYLWDWTMR